ncbi:AAA family ATPase [Rhizobium sp. No.120]
MRSLISLRSERQPLSLPIIVAQMAVRRAIRPFLSATCFVVAVKLPSLDDFEAYLAATRDLLDPFNAVSENGDRPVSVDCAKAISQSGWGLVQRFRNTNRAVLFYSDETQISAELGMVLDQRIVLHPPEPKLWMAAARELSLPMTAEEASYLATQSLHDIHAAMRRGRPISRVVRQMQSRTQPTRESEPPPRPENAKTRLEHLAGYGEAKVWGMQLAEDLRLWQQGEIEWRDVDRGVVLCGPPGCGKTTYALALANSCRVNFISESAAAWQAKGHLGDMLKAMRGAFKRAQDERPAILFLDEFDSFGDRRTNQNDPHHDYKRQVINGLLECLDPAGGREGVVVVAATNDADRIDPALLRPGRLEKVVEIPLPDEEARRAIIEYHLPGHELGDLTEFVRQSEGWTGADIEKLARDARRLARKSGRAVIRATDVTDAMPPSVPFTEEERFRLAVHEIGHAVVGHVLRPEALVKVWIRSGKSSKAAYGNLGETQFQNLIPYMGKACHFRDQIAILLAGMAAERVILGDHSTGAGGDAKGDLGLANDTATMMERSLGFGDDLLMDMGYGQRPWENMRRQDRQLQGTVRQRLDTELARATEILAERRVQVEALARLLSERQELSAAEIRHGLDGEKTS